MTATSANRAAFISSLVSFMSHYGFQGADLDWEYPGAYDRGGSYADTANYVSLVQEMRAAFGTQYGISLTLAPDPGAVNGFDAISMQPYVGHICLLFYILERTNRAKVDFFGFMSYDLHGSWDVNNAAGTIVRGQTDAREIRNDSLALWFDGLNPAKINFGLAYYGRGYTLGSSSCAYMGCAFTGPSKAAPCTNQAGVMSLVEIQTLIQQKNLVPELLSAPMMKQITWDDQWIGYDDVDTIALKKSVANSLCFGGTMAWSVDFNSGTGSGSTPDKNVPITTDGSCGASNNYTICGNWPSGGCCSSSGYCGSAPAYCGSGCQSGPCSVGGTTTDGTCGPSQRNTTCGSWPAGSCCSSSGYCGNTDAHCGTGCTSGCTNSTSGTGSDGGSGTVYIESSIWHTANPVVQCQPPCEFVLPPFTLSSAQTITWPPFTTSVLSSSNGVIVTITTVFTIPVFTVSEIDFWPVLVRSTDPTVATFTGEQSVMPPIYTVTMPGAEASIQVTEPTTSATSTTLVPPVFYGSSHVVTFQPQPTVSIPIPPPGGGPSPITYSKGPAKPTCTSGCGHINCDFGCPGPGGHHCGIFGCGFGCGLFGCGQSCGLFGCLPGSDSASNNPDGNPDNCQGAGCSSTECTNPKTIGSACSVQCPQTVVPWTTITGNCKTTCTSTSTSCGATDSTTTSTSTKTITYPASDRETEDVDFTIDLSSPEATQVYLQMQVYLAAEDSATITAATTSATASATTSASTATITSAPAPQPTLCSFGADPNGGNAEGYCQCSGFPYNLPPLSSTTDPYYPCGYTSLPDPYPFTSTDSAGDIIACQTSSVDSGSTACSGASSTASTAPPQATCLAQRAVLDLNQGLEIIAVGIWTNNYITDGGAALKAAEHKDCGFVLSTWTVAGGGTSFVPSDGPIWTATQKFLFNISASALSKLDPAGLACAASGIFEAGGPTTSCPWVPTLEG